MRNGLLSLSASFLSIVLLYSCATAPADNKNIGGSTTTVNYDYYVATNGSDSNPGTESQPFKTITHAVQTAETNKSIKVAPGIYDLANGETFPIVLKKDQVLIGDSGNKGKGATPTKISGQSPVAVDGFMKPAVHFTNRSIVCGFAIDTVNNNFGTFCVAVSNAEAGLISNTLEIAYGGVGIILASNALFAYNVVNNNSYGIRDMEYRANAVITILGNQFLDAGVDVVNGNSNHRIFNNTFLHSDFGVLVQNGNPVISSNVFSNLNGFNYGGVWCQSITRAKLRYNMFYCASNTVRFGPNDQANPDMGTNGDPGNNDFSHVSGNAVFSTNDGQTKTNFAIGNIWAHSPPTAADIILTGINVDWVFYGINPGEFVH